MSRMSTNQHKSNADAQTSAVKISEPVAWQYREKIPNGTWGIWRHCDVVREDTNLDYRPLYLGVAQAAPVLGDIEYLKDYGENGYGNMTAGEAYKKGFAAGRACSVPSAKGNTQ